MTFADYFDQLDTTALLESLDQISSHDCERVLGKKRSPWMIF